MGSLEKRDIRKGDQYLKAGDYDNCLYYYQHLLTKVESHYPKNDDRVILAYEKLADAEAAFGARDSALRYYRIGLDELRNKIKDKDMISEVSYEKELNTTFIRMLINCGNVYLQLSQNRKVKKRKISEYCENSVLCYLEALPIIQELKGMKSAYCTKVVQRLIGARDNLAKYYLESNKINLASTQYQESIKTILPFLNELGEECERSLTEEEKKTSNSVQSNETDKSYRLMQYLYLKLHINVGNLCLRQNRLDYVVIEYGEALERLGLHEDDEEYDRKLEDLPVSVAKLVTTISHNLGVIAMKRGMLEETEIARNHFERAIRLHRKHESCPALSILGLGEA